ncbi:hypothetical protein CR513_21447, partial [Mucuna pruriens]
MKFYDSENKPELYVLFLCSTTACYDIESQIFNSRQGILSVIEYYCTLNGLWIKGRIFKFLHGLNSKYDPIQVQILGKEKLPSLFEVFFIVRNEETQQSVMLDKGCSNTRSAMVIGKCFTKRLTSKGKPFTKSSHGEYCTIPTTRFMERRKFLNELVEIKPNLDLNILLPRNLTRMFKPFSKEEMDHLRALTNSTSKSLGSCGLTVKSKSSFNISSSVPQSI